ncbi:MAG: CotH kinase family protein [Acidobacteria bacterium]|nr:CotH kinase family protein [Acidobacteriota bacterium]
MTTSTRLLLVSSILASLSLSTPDVSAQFGPGGGGGRGGGRGGMGGGERVIVPQFDTDKDGRLDTAERQAAREWLATQGNGGGRGGFGRGGGRGGNRPPASPGVRLTPADVAQFPNTPLYDAGTLRTFFIELENPDWEAELVAFNNTDVDVPARVTVDGKVYPGVGIHFRGNSSFGVGNGYKRSLNLSFDFIDEDQDILGYRTLNFLNANEDPTMMRTVLSMHIARQHVPAPRANFVRVVINGENWGVYANAQQFNKEWANDNFKTTKGDARWKVPQGGGGGIGGFRYMGDDPGAYRNTFEIKSKDEAASWNALINLARVLDTTPVAQLEAALAPILDIDGYLKFLALDNVMASGDGFYSRTADYSLYLDTDGRFHFTFHDANEMFSAGGGRGGGGGFGGGGGVRLDPLVSANDAGKPIISKVLAVPALRVKYIAYVKEMAQKSLDWNALGPVVKQYRDLIAADVARDTRKLMSTEAFMASTADDGSLRTFIDERRAFLLNWTPQ